jgi:outer membrane protein TolC
MRWKTMMVGLALGLAAAIGCKQQCFLSECDYNHYRDIGLPPNLECSPAAAITPATSIIAAPATVLSPEREIRYITLTEAIAMGLERGTIGSPALNGTSNTSLVSFTGQGVFAPENNIRVLAYDPAIIASNIEASLAKFDVHWTTNMTWTTTDQPVATAFQAFQANGTTNVINTNDANFTTSLLKPLPTGGVAGITFNTNYELSNLPNPVNPSYRPSLQFQFEQPLLQGFGIEINQIRPTHPGSVLTPFNVGGRVEGVLITRIRFDQQRAEFERNVDILLVNVEVAYWNLYGAYWSLYSREQGLRQSFEAYRINKERFEAGRVAIQELAQTRQQYESFRAQRIQALGQVLENERALRYLMGLPVEDGTRLVPIDTPTLAPYRPDWTTAINEALALRPELVMARADLKARQFDLMNQKNLLLPDLRFTSTYDINGIGTHLDGGASDGNNAFASLADNKFHDWSLGLRMDMQLGFRDAHAAVRFSRLSLARAYALLQDQEERAHQFLSLEYVNIAEFYELIIAQRAQREAAAEQLDARFKEFLAGRGTLDFLLEAQRVWADALRDEWNAIVQYNNALCTFEYAKGTILQHDNVTIGEGPLPHCAQVRAVEHERERAKAIVLRERAQPVIHPVTVGAYGSLPAPAVLPKDTTPSIPSLLEGQGPAPKMPEQLPLPHSSDSRGPQSYLTPPTLPGADKSTPSPGAADPAPSNSSSPALPGVSPDSTPSSQGPAGAAAAPTSGAFSAPAGPASSPAGSTNAMSQPLAPPAPLPSANPFPSPMSATSPSTALPLSSNGFPSSATAASPPPTPLPDSTSNGLLPASSSAASASPVSSSAAGPVSPATQWSPAPAAPVAPTAKSRASSPYATYDAVPGK